VFARLAHATLVVVLPLGSFRESAYQQRPFFRPRLLRPAKRPSVLLNRTEPSIALRATNPRLR
jgi:hypothetical protein